jgi:hypothetical protein
MTSVTSRPLSGNGPLQYIFIGYVETKMLHLNMLISKYETQISQMEKQMKMISETEQ